MSTFTNPLPAAYEGGTLEIIERLDAIDPPYVWEYMAEVIMPDGRVIEGVVQGDDQMTGGDIYNSTFEANE